MNSVHTMFVALLAVSVTTLAQSPSESSRPANKHELQSALTDDEALALTAMEGLISQPPDRALPIIKKVLAGSQTTIIKQRALFVLSQINVPESDEILLQAIRSADVALRNEAIRSIGIGGRSRSLGALQEVYDAGSAEVKAQVLQAWMIADRKKEVYQAALNAKSEEEASAAIRMLSAMGATDELRQLGDRPRPAGRSADADTSGRDLGGLRRIAEGNGELSVRVKAVHEIGGMRIAAARDALRDIYLRSDDQVIKSAALQGMLIGADEQGVLALYRAAKTSDEKRLLLRALTTINGDAAIKAIDAALEP